VNREGFWVWKDLFEQKDWLISGERERSVQRLNDGCFRDEGEL